MRPRLLLALAAALVLVPAALLLAFRMPEFGAHPLPYGDAATALMLHERHVTNMVSGVNFDLRAIDTLGEEIMLLAAVGGAVMLLRGARGEGGQRRAAAIPGRPIPRRSEAVVLLCRLLAPVTLLFGLYVVLHAQLTPGGGFQGGVIIASAMLLVWLGEGYAAWRRMLPGPLLHALEGGGAALYALAGLAGLALGDAFLANVLPPGESGSLLSGGLIPLLNLGVALAVAGGFAMLFLEFLEETRAPEEGEE
ncbi:sodium:proton antiporter [Belnapia sp. T6]|uniref:Sodium:proton antiporter n=1 Tax=Belnapia mucosa TaxID=2804532 RepID=A0ABS1V6R2_9PROT|nr:MnhB domain-containing protein [Belnapia mucosa]MBL6456424.1 sodium:proton antiporter [Belnapia mucosa]